MGEITLKNERNFGVPWELDCDLIYLTTNKQNRNLNSRFEEIGSLLYGNPLKTCHKFLFVSTWSPQKRSHLIIPWMGRKTIFSRDKTDQEPIITNGVKWGPQQKLDVFGHILLGVILQITYAIIYCRNEALVVPKYRYEPILHLPSRGFRNWPKNIDQTIHECMVFT